MTTVELYIGQPGNYTQIGWDSFRWLDAAGIVNDTLSFTMQGNIELPEPGFAFIYIEEGDNFLEGEFALRSVLERERHEYSEYTFTANRVVNTATSLQYIKNNLFAQLNALISPALSIGSAALNFERFSLPTQIARLAGEARGASDATLLSRAMFDYLLSQITQSQLTWGQFRRIIEESGWEVYYDENNNPQLFDPLEWRVDGYQDITVLDYLEKSKDIPHYSKREGPWYTFYGNSSVEITDPATGEITMLGGVNAPTQYTHDRIHDTRFVTIFDQAFGSWAEREIAIKRDIARKRARTLSFQCTTRPDLTLRPRQVYWVDNLQCRVETVTRAITGSGDYSTTVRLWDLQGNT